MNLYEKLVESKNRLLAMNLKKTGKNSFSNYDYYELSDFLPAIVKMEKELKFCCAVSFGLEAAELLIIDMEDPTTKLSVVSPMSTAELKGMHAIQNLGAVQTYLRRYLYMSAFEIVEHDAIDGSDKKPEPKPAAKPANEPKQEVAKQSSDICKVFLPNVQYRVDKVEDAKDKNGKPYKRILIHEGEFALMVLDFDNHQIKDGDFLMMKIMKPIESKEYRGQTTYYTIATIELANSLSQQSFVDDNTPLPFD